MVWPMSTDTPSGADRPPLDGVRVVDMTQVIAGPYCTAMMADLGADVAKIERPDTGDDLRTVGRYKGREDHEDYFNASNRSKRSVALDLKDEGDRAIAHELVKKADVLVENFAPGTAGRIGMGWDDLRPLNDKLIYCSLSGYGQTGPYRNRFALDPMIQAITGVMSVTGDPDGPPMQIGAPLGDVMSGMFAAFAIIGALRAVERGEKGRHIDISMQDAMLATLGPRMGEPLQAGHNPGRFGNENPLRVPANTYLTRDDHYLTVIAQNDRQWPQFCRALGHPEWLDDERYATTAKRVEHRIELDRLTAERFAEHDLAEWIDRLGAERVPYAEVNDYMGALEDEQVAHRGLVRTLDHPHSGPIRVVGPPWIMSGATAEMRPPPMLGQHTEDVLSDWLDWDEAAINRIRTEAAE